MTNKEDLSRFAQLGFEDFRRLASDPSLSAFEKIGFPNSYREGREHAIFLDIVRKLPPLERRGATVLDIGPGCSDVPKMLIDHCVERGHQLHLVDSEEMLSHLPDRPGVSKTAAFFPECPDLLSSLSGRTDAIVVYSVLHYIFVDTNVWRFIDVALDLLAPQGALLLGDIPNLSMRKRFFASAAGKAFHRDFTGRDEDPEIHHNRIEAGSMDDSVVFAILQRARLAGFNAYVVPQPSDLPMSNRREDILIVRP